MDTLTPPLHALSGDTAAKIVAFLEKGGPAIWAIALLSVATVALILWKTWRLTLSGAFFGGRCTLRAAQLWQQGERDTALGMVGPTGSKLRKWPKSGTFVNARSGLHFRAAWRSVAPGFGRMVDGAVCGAGLDAFV